METWLRQLAFSAMAQSLSNLLVHVVFSTRHREPLIKKESQPALFSYTAKVAANLGCKAFQVGGIATHIHLAIRIPKTLSVSQLVEKIKTSSSQWLKKQEGISQAFAWQRGYGAFSFSASDLTSVCNYIKTQEEHHREMTFEDEYLKLLKLHRVDFDETKLWD